MRALVLAIAVVLAAVAFAACGSDDGGCPGITCSNCALSGDCNVSCSPSQVEVCIAHPENSNLRCAYCE